ncbi:unnamed protein product [Arabis nemorensis]|uniref:Peptidase C1A papain C-terminal domain-containing protein n=1 Tax=Arabis nemorensis TaxID=586526 RepID=A0A565B1Q7_9BRAS|nr:unnamed protein product [Arabis nemorensis]
MVSLLFPYAPSYSKQQVNFVFVTVLRNSWHDKRPDLNFIPEQYTQRVGNCWAVAYYRQWYMLMRLNGIPLTDLSIESLMDGVSQRHKGRGHGLRNFQAVADFMKKEGHVVDMVLHENPFGKSEDESFEKKNLDLFEKWTSGGAYQGLLSPTSVEIERHEYEFCKTHHASTLMGRGVYIEDGKEPKEYWDIYESYGLDWGQRGDIRLARHEGLIISAVEMKLKAN